MAASKRKRTVGANGSTGAGIEAARNGATTPPTKQRASGRNITSAATTATTVNPDFNSEVFDAPNATRASPDAGVNGRIVPGRVGNGEVNGDGMTIGNEVKKGRGRKKADGSEVKAAEGDVAAVIDAAASNVKKGGRKGKTTVKIEEDGDTDSMVSAPSESKPAKKSTDAPGDPEVDDIEDADEEEVKEALSRPPPVHSDYLPLPWKGRLGYACLNTYLRNSNPPVFSSRTCRIQSILEHRHPLQDPSQPEHSTKNRPDKNKPADVELGKRYVESLGLANVYDIAKMIRWNHRYGIKFLRLSSEMFPFASHPEYGYKLAPFAANALAEAGKVIAELGHRVTTHPGQFTQLGSPRKPVIDNAIRDLDYHDEMLSLLKLPEQQNRDAVMILHMGGLFEGKQETLQRFREYYATLSQSVKNRLVLENDDVVWNVHDLLPICEELNIPLVLDYHHHNIMFDSTQLREGTKDIMDLYPRIKATWDRKGITQKMHYSEPTPPAITPRQRRKHNPRVATLPPCATDMDLMIEAKDKEQAVFELMRTFKLPGYDTFNDIIPYVRDDDNKAALAVIAKHSRSKKKDSEPEPEVELIPEAEVGMGGPEGRVYWPPGMEEWLRPKKREVKKKEPVLKDAAKIKKEAAEAYAAREAEKRAEANGALDEHEESDLDATPATKKAKAAMRKKASAGAAKAATKATNGVAKGNKKPVKTAKQVVTAEESSESDELSDLSFHEDDQPPDTPVAKRPAPGGRKSSGRAAKRQVTYAEEDDE